MIRRLALALAVVLATTAGMRAYAPTQTTMTQTRIAVLTSVHGPGVTAYAESALARVYAYQPDAVILVDDVMLINPAFSGLTNADSAVNRYLAKIRQKSMVRCYGGVNNHDYMTDRIWNATFRAHVTGADSLDPLRYARQAIPMMDWYGNYVQDIGVFRFIFLNTCYTASLLDTCVSDSLKWAIRDTLYQPASMFSNWNTATGAGYLSVKAWIQSSNASHTILVAPNGFYPVQSEGSTGAWSWNRNKVFMAMLDSTTTASGKKVTAVLSGHQHCYWRVLARGDSAIAHASGGIDHVNGPPCSASHAPAAKAQDFGALVFPDTVPAARIARWQDHGGINGALLTAGSGSKTATLLTRPAWMILDGSQTSLTWTVYDSSSVKDTWTRGVR